MLCRRSHLYKISIRMLQLRNLGRLFIATSRSLANFLRDMVTPMAARDARQQYLGILPEYTLRHADIVSNKPCFKRLSVLRDSGDGMRDCNVRRTASQCQVAQKTIRFRRQNNIERATLRPSSMQ